MRELQQQRGGFVTWKALFMILPGLLMAGAGGLWATYRAAITDIRETSSAVVMETRRIVQEHAKYPHDNAVSERHFNLQTELLVERWRSVQVLVDTRLTVMEAKIDKLDQKIDQRIPGKTGVRE